jgi:hypothetical protein
MSEFHIAQMNVGHAAHPLGDPRMKDFMENLDRINALAEASPGFVWRLKDESNNATGIKLTDDPSFIVNMSVWASVEALFEFVYRTDHTAFLVRRREWFRKPEGPIQAMWWIPAGTVPTTAEGLARLARLAAEGPTASAFTFKHRFPPPGMAGPVTDMKPEPYCVGWA